MKMLLLSLLLLSPIAVFAEAPEAAPEALRPFAPLVGTSWIATFPNGKITDEQHFEWVYGGKFLRNVHWVRDLDGNTVYEGETIYAWDHRNEQIVWWYWNTTGGYVVGTIEATDDGWRTEGENHAPGTQTPRVRGAVRNVRSESWDAVQIYERDGTWVEQWTMTYRPKN